MKHIQKAKKTSALMAALLAIGIAASPTLPLCAGGPGGGSGGGSGSGGSGSGGGGGGSTASVNVGACTQITSFTSVQEYNGFYPADNFPANAVFIGTDLEGISDCTSMGTGPLIVSIWYKNNQTGVTTAPTTVAWPLGVALGMTAGTFAPPATSFTVFYTVADSSGHTILSSSQNLTTLPAL